MRKTIMAKSIVTAFLLLGGAQEALAHGVFAKAHSKVGASGEKLVSRAELCYRQVNTNCQTNDPHSLEGQKGFPNGGAPDGKIGNGNTGHGPQLNEQSSSRWVKQKVVPGPMEMSWYLTVLHRTKNYQYFMTKEGWDPNAPLSRDSFEVAPFCQVDMGDSDPSQNLVTHNCNLPERTGYHVMLALWNNTWGGAFYQVTDVDYGNEEGIPSQWEMASGSTIQPSEALSRGTEIKTRVFGTQAQELPQYQTSITLTEDVTAQQWGYVLANKINNTSGLPIKAGQKSTNGDEFTAVQGNNPVYFKKGSNIKNMVVDIVKPDVGVTPEVYVSGLASEYIINNEQVALDFTVNTNSHMKVKATLQNVSTGLPVMTQEKELNNSNALFSMKAENIQAGQYQMIVFGESLENNETTQQSFNMTFKAEGQSQEYDYIYPQNTGSYKSGTIVLQPKNNKLYECKPWPANGYCGQYHPSANHFEPGVGHFWQEAWVEVK